MDRVTIVSLNIPGNPVVKMTLPCPLRVGDRVALRFALRRMNNGRQERLEVVGDWRVTTATASSEAFRIEVDPTGLEPSWKAVKKERPFVRQLTSPLFPRTVVT